MKINFSILGSGYVVKLFNKQSLLYQKTEHLDGNEIREALYDNTKFLQLKLNKPANEIASTFHELRPDKQFVIYDFDRISRVEIKMKNRSRIKLFFKDVIAQDLLFPICNYIDIPNPFSSEEGLMILENDIGSFGKCEIETEVFDIDALCFDVFKMDIINITFISKIQYAKQDLLFRKKEGLFSGRTLITKN